MNNKKRKRLQEALDIIEDVVYEEQESLDNLPDGIRESEKADKMEEYIQYMDSAKDELEQILLD